MKLKPKTPEPTVMTGREEPEVENAQEKDDFNPADVLKTNGAFLEVKDMEDRLEKEVDKMFKEELEEASPDSKDIGDIILSRLMQDDPRIGETPMLLALFVEIMKYRWLKKKKKVCELTATINQITKSVYISEEDVKWMEA